MRRNPGRARRARAGAARVRCRRAPTRRPATTTWRCSTSARARSPRPSPSARRRSRCAPTTPPPTCTLGNLYRAQGNYDKAAGEYETDGQARSPRTRQRTRNLGAAYVRLKRVDDGIRELETAVELKPDEYETRAVARLRLQAEGRLQARHRAPAEGDRAQARRRPRPGTTWASPSRRPTTRTARSSPSRRRSRSSPTTPSCTSTWPWSTAASARPTRRSPSTRWRSQKNPQLAQGLLRPRHPLLAGQEERRGARRVREVPRVRHQRGRRLAQGRRGAPQDLQGSTTAKAHGQAGSAPARAVLESTPRRCRRIWAAAASAASLPQSAAVRGRARPAARARPR